MESGDYIQDWLQVKKKPSDKYDTFWCVLKPLYSPNKELFGAELQFYVDRNTSQNNFRGAITLNYLHGDTVALVEMKGNKKNKCKFTTVFQLVDHTRTVNKINQVEISFLAYEDIIRERWAYALCDLVGNMRPPEELPTKYNGKLASRPRKFEKPKNLKSVRKMSLQEIMAPVSMQEHNGPFIPFDNSSNRKTSSSTSPVSKNPPPISPSAISPVTRNNSLKHCTWYFGKITRMTSQNLLAERNPGTFLLRDSSRPEAEFAFSYKDTENQVQHVLIYKKPDGKYSMDEDSILKETPMEACKGFLGKYYSHLSCQPYYNNLFSGKSKSEKLPQSKRNKASHQLLRQRTVPSNIGRPQVPTPPRPRYEVMSDDIPANISSFPYEDVEIDEENGYLQLTNLQNMNLTEKRKLFMDGGRKIEEDLNYSEEPLPPPIGDNGEKKGYLVSREYSGPSDEIYLTVDKEYWKNHSTLKDSTGTDESYVTMRASAQVTTEDNDEYLKLSSPNKDTSEERYVTMKAKVDNTDENLNLHPDNNDPYVIMKASTEVMSYNNDNNNNDDDLYLNMSTPTKASIIDFNEERYVTMKGNVQGKSDGDDENYQTMSAPSKDPSNGYVTIKASTIVIPSSDVDEYLKMSTPTTV